MPLQQTGEPLTCQQIRELDVLAIEHVGIPGIVLMENAGRGAAEVIYSFLPNPVASRVLILCGPGNNGGDGFVVARNLRNAGVSVSVALALPAEKSSGDAATNLAILQRLGCTIRCAADSADLDAIRADADAAEIIVDALLGTGATGAPRGGIAELIQLANGSKGPRKIAIDIPSAWRRTAETCANRAFAPIAR